MEEEHPVVDALDILRNIYQVSSSQLTDGSFRGVSHNWFLFSFYANLVLCYVNVAANAFLIITILRFRKLWTRMNFYLMNIAISNTFYQLAFRVILKSARAFGSVSITQYCYAQWMEDSGCFTKYLFATTLIVDWYLVNFKANFVQAHVRLYRLMIPLVYLVSLVRFLALAVLRCHAVMKVVGFLPLVYLTYFLALVVVAVANYFRYRKRNEKQIENRYALVAGNFIILSWLPLFIFNILLMIGYSSHIIFVVMFYAIEVPAILAQTNCIVLLYVLWKMNEDFRQCFRLFFKWKVTGSGTDGTEEVQHQVGGEQVTIDTEALIALTNKIRHR